MGFILDPLTVKNETQVSAPPIARNDYSQPTREQYTELQKQQANQDTLAQMLMQQAQGGGPNPAQAQLQQNLNQITAQQAGAIASQKGISPALAARLIAQQAGGARQQAAGQEATLQAQQQLASQGLLQQQQAQQAQEALSAQNIFQNANAAQNQAITGGSLGAQQLAAGIAGQNAAGTNELLKGIIAGGAAVGASAAGKPKAAHGGIMAKNMKQGGHVPGKAQHAGDDERNDTVHAMLSPGEIVVPRTKAKDPEKAKEFIEHLQKMHGGGKVSSYSEVTKLRKEIQEKKKRLRELKG